MLDDPDAGIVRRVLGDEPKGPIDTHSVNREDEVCCDDSDIGPCHVWPSWLKLPVGRPNGLLARTWGLNNVFGGEGGRTHVNKRPPGLKASHLYLVIEILVAFLLRSSPRMKKSRNPFKNPRP